MGIPSTSSSSSSSSTDSSSASGNATSDDLNFCCVEYSAPYVQSSYALLSIVRAGRGLARDLSLERSTSSTTRALVSLSSALVVQRTISLTSYERCSLMPFSSPLHTPSQAQVASADILGTLTSADVINSLCAVLLTMFIGAWLSWIIEGRSNPNMNRIERNVCESRAPRSPCIQCYRCESCRVVLLTGVCVVDWCVTPLAHADWAVVTLTTARWGDIQHMLPRLASLRS